MSIKLKVEEKIFSNRPEYRNLNHKYINVDIIKNGDLDENLKKGLNMIECRDSNNMKFLDIKYVNNMLKFFIEINQIEKKEIYRILKKEVVNHIFENKIIYIDIIKM